MTTGIVLLNLGGPRDLDEVEPFLVKLFADREIIKLPWQSILGPFIARRRTPAVRELYRAIGGGSPLLSWTQRQAAGMVERLDRLSPETAPHLPFVAFRYAAPSSEDALVAMAEAGVERAVAFTQYPQFSCATTGSSLNELWRAADRVGLADRFSWSVIDRWYLHPGFIEAMVQRVREGLEGYPEEERGDVLLLFSAHSLPLEMVKRGDPYIREVSATVDAVVEALGGRHPFTLSWQSEVGPVAWMGPSTERTIADLASMGVKNALVVPIAFTSDHIETLSELDIELAEQAHAAGMTGFRRAPALNDHPGFIDAMADIVHRHLSTREVCSPLYGVRCGGCTNAACRNILRPATPYTRLPLPAARG